MLPASPPERSPISLTNPIEALPAAETATFDCGSIRAESNSLE
jgi:hypothetical protein